MCSSARPMAQSVSAAARCAEIGEVISKYMGEE